MSTLDVYYLNNVADSQLPQLGKLPFEDKLSKAFEFLEQARSEGKIKHYGLSNWQAFRVGEGHPSHLSLRSVMRIAEKVAGKTHGMKFVQLPVKFH